MLRGFIGRVLRDSSLVWLLFSSGYPWYRGGVEGWAGRSGRLDIVARVAAAVCRGGVVVAAVLRGLGVLILPCTRGFVDELDAGAALLDALRGGFFQPGVGGRELVGVLRAYGFRVVLLREGCRVSLRLPGGRVAVALGADVDPPVWLGGVADDCIGLGERSYLASVVAAFYSMTFGLD